MRVLLNNVAIIMLLLSEVSLAAPPTVSKSYLHVAALAMLMVELGRFPARVPGPWPNQVEQQAS